MTPQEIELERRKSVARSPESHFKDAFVFNECRGEKQHTSKEDCIARDRNAEDFVPPGAIPGDWDPRDYGKHDPIKDGPMKMDAGDYTISLEAIKPEIETYGDKIILGPGSKKYQQNWERIFGNG